MQKVLGLSCPHQVTSPLDDSIAHLPGNHTIKQESFFVAKLVLPHTLISGVLPCLKFFFFFLQVLNDILQAGYTGDQKPQVSRERIRDTADHNTIN